jgi:hypothetical protein
MNLNRLAFARALEVERSDFERHTSRMNKNFQETEVEQMPNSTSKHHKQLSDIEIPEMNTNFMENLFHDPTFVERFDSGFADTVPMEMPSKPVSKTGQPVAGTNMIELDF